jgi:hypothetical protein
LGWGVSPVAGKSSLSSHLSELELTRCKLLLNPKKQYDDVSAGLLEIPLIIRRYDVLEKVYRSYEHIPHLKESFEEKVIKLYSCILQNQARAVCQWSRNALHQYGHDVFVFQADGWSKLFKEIKDLDSGCKEIAQTMDAGLWQNALEEQNVQLQNMLQDWSSQQQELLKELRDSMQKSLNLKEIRRHERLEQAEKGEERACHQVFGPSTYLEQDRNPSRVPGTCKWFLNHDTFINWKELESSSLL